MSDLDHRAGVKEVNLVKRRLKLDRLATDSVESVLQAIDGLYGVDRVSLDAQTGCLQVDYDATHCHIDQILALVADSGSVPANGLFNRARLSYYRFVDQNLRDNAAHVPHCCNKSPK